MGKTNSSEQKIKKVRLQLIFLYTAIVVVAIISLAAFILERSGEVLKQKVGTLVSVIDSQMAVNLKNFQQEIEDTSTLIFSSQENYQYDTANPDMDEYEHLQRQTAIANRLLEISLMENVGDFGIVYRDGISIGRVSNGTKDLYGAALFDELTAMITDPVKQDGWGCGYQDNYERLYYVKKLNDNSILETGIYTTELEGIFEQADVISDMTILLTDENNVILYDSQNNSENIGLPVPADIVQMLGQQTAAVIVNETYILAVEELDNWKVICYMPVNSILKENQELKVFTVLIALAVILATFAVSVVLVRNVTNSVSDMVNTLDEAATIDQLTGVLRKKSFEQTVDILLAEGICKKGALLIFDIDDFKSYNDTFGHQYGDAVLASIGELLKEHFGKAHVMGRLGGDEFMVFIQVPEKFQEPPEVYIEDMVKRFCEKLTVFFAQENWKKDVTISAGIALYPVDGTEFQSLYVTADKALYVSKENGKNQYTILGKGEDADE